jgi:anaerobic selenocysteine-containing dehydrogenase
MIQLGAVLTDPGLAPPVEALYVWNSNPAVIAANQQRVLAGLARDALFTVVHDQFLTDTARYADLVLPATTMLEHADLVGSWGFSYVSWNEAAIAPIGESRSNAEVARNLAERLGYTDDVFTLSDHELMERALRGSGAELAGIDASALRRDGFRRLGAPVGAAVAAERTFEFRCDRLAAAGLDPVAAYHPPAHVPAPDGAFPLRLLTLKRHRSINSSYGSLPVLLHAEPTPAAEINPVDAAARGIADGTRIRVFNERGAITCTASVSDRSPAGTVAVPFGRWREGDEPTANTLTSDELGDLANGPTFCDNLVEVEALGQSSRGSSRSRR